MRNLVPQLPNIVNAPALTAFLASRPRIVRTGVKIRASRNVFLRRLVMFIVAGFLISLVAVATGMDVQKVSLVVGAYIFFFQPVLAGPARGTTIADLIAQRLESSRRQPGPRRI